MLCFLSLLSMAKSTAIFTILFLSLLSQASLAYDYGLHPNCGNVILSLPFCMGNSCYNNNQKRSFSVTCSTDSPHGKPTPILNRLKLELIEIQQVIWTNGQVTVNIPTPGSGASACSSGDGSWSSVDLSNTPYSFDTEQNVFVSIGCGPGNASLYLHKRGGGRPVYGGGCSSTCEPAGQVIDGCKGYYCCQIDLRAFDGIDIKRYTVEVGGSSSNSCRTGFLTSRTFLVTNTTIATAKLDSVAVVPAVLLWTNSPGYSVSFSPYPTNIGIGFVTLLASCCCGWSCWFWVTKERRNEIRLRAKYFKRRLDEEWFSNIELVEKTKLFSKKMLKKSTNNFNKDRILGKGGQGTVYKGMLTKGQVIAVKKLKGFDEREWKEFINEVILLSKVKHRNVVKLLGCCLETKPPMLVYEFIPNGTLSQHIYVS